MKIRLPFLMLLIMFIVPIIALQAQLIKVSTEVKQAFEAKYPGAKEVDWTNNFGDPEVTFVQEGRKCKAQFTSKGVWKKTESKSSYDSLPEIVKEGFNKSKYARKWKVNAVTIIEKPDALLYKLNISKSDVQLKNLYFNEKGQLQKDPVTI